MLKLLSDVPVVLNTDDFYIVEKASGLDELIFNISIYDPNYTHVVEEAIIEYEQPYLIKAIDAGKSTAKVKCQIDLDALKRTFYLNYTNNSASLTETVSAVIPSGWVFIDNSLSTIRRTIEGNYTPYDIIVQCADVFGVVFRFDVVNQRVTAYDLDSFQPMGAFASRELNLTEINYKGKSTDFFTRLYAYGKDGLSFASINNGNPYVDCTTYIDKIICAYWQNERYTDMQSLLDAAQAAVNEAGNPVRSYECTVYDLAATNPEMYGFQDFSLFSVIRLIDDIKQVSINYQVVEYWRYPCYPEKNLVTLSTTAAKIQNQVQSIKNEISNQQSPFWTSLGNAINNATNMITGVNGGYVVINQNADGQPFEILVMDQPSISTAVNVWRWNQAGFGHSSNGYNGPYTTAITMDGSIVANFITAGTMLANIIKGGTLTLGGTENGDGVCVVYDADGNVVIRMDNTGLRAVDSQIIGPSITFGDPNGTNVVAENSDDNTGIQFTGSGKINFQTVGQFMAANMFSTSSNVMANEFSMTGGSSPLIGLANFNSQANGDVANSVLLYQSNGASFLYSTNRSLDDFDANVFRMASQNDWNFISFTNLYNGSSTQTANFLQLSTIEGTCDIQLTNYLPGSSNVANSITMGATSSSTYFNIVNNDLNGNARCGLYLNQNGSFTLTANTGGLSQVYTDANGNLVVSANNLLKLVSQNYYVQMQTGGQTYRCVWKNINGQMTLCGESG